MRDLSWLLEPEAIRERCEVIYRAAESDALEHFALKANRLDDVADFVIATTRTNYPDLKIPYHSRWRHFSSGGIDRWRKFLQAHKELSPEETARISIDLAVTSVLLDAGAGDTWRYAEPESGNVYQRSEGLAIASFHAFVSGAFSSDLNAPCRADALALRRLTQQDLAQAFQVTQDNELIGLAGRVSLLNRLAEALQSQPQRFGNNAPRIGNLFDVLAKRAMNGQLPAAAILHELLHAFSTIWPVGTVIKGKPLGDVWHHPVIVTEDPTSGLVPFHKLSQWLTYSLVEPLQQTGLVITELEALTGLPEYRNGGLFIDMDVLQPRYEQIVREPQRVESEAVVEWRALTVALLDRVAQRVRTSLKLDQEQLPLVKVLEGGTWSAGRRIALERRADGGPPIRLQSDGTVF
ncbi:MAG: URC4/urg3 family protein [Gammaproteobacteria bacterium]|nr:URC4/urg3 family protein [Gammaproteobacteria bacterium]